MEVGKEAWRPLEVGKEVWRPLEVGKEVWRLLEVCKEMGGWSSLSPSCCCHWTIWKEAWVTFP